MRRVVTVGNCNQAFIYITRQSTILSERMSSPDVLKRFETRAATAEDLIKTLRTEIEEVKKLKAEEFSKENLDRLRSENEQLKTEVEKWKNRLIELEIKGGIEQVPLPQTGKENTTAMSIPKSALPVATATAAPTNEAKIDKKKPAAEKKAKSGGGGSGPPAVAEEPPVDVGRLDFRVGRIVTAKKHPDADSLYVEEVDVGEEKPRTVVSGLVKYVPLEAMQGRLVVLLCNLKASKMRGVTSEAMVMCASTPDKVEILTPPTGSVPGDLVHVDGFPRLPDAVLNPKKKIFETVAPDLKTSADKVATYKGIALSVPGKGYVTAPSLVGVPIK